MALARATQRKVCSRYKGVYNLQQDVYKVDMRGVKQIDTRPKGTTLDICCS